MIPTKEEWNNALCERYGEDVQKKFSAATVAVCGLGGLGSNIAITLARAGIGRLILIDFDRVDITNLHRQQYKVNQIRKYKTEALFDILKEIERRIPGFPIVLHGSSSVPQDMVKIINEHGGAIKDAVGIPEEQLREAAKSAVCKVNIDSDGRLAMTAAIRQHFAEKPADFDPRKYLGPAREWLKNLYIHKCKEVLGSAGKA